MLAVQVAQHNETKKIVEVHEVARGLDANVSCLACGLPLLARKGSIREWHFAHVSDNHNRGNGGGPGCGESWIHAYAKRIIIESVGRTIKLPDMGEGILHHIESANDEVQILGGRRQVDILANVRLAYRAHGKRRFMSGSRPLVIEINVTHAKESSFALDVEEAGIEAAEIHIDRDIIATCPPSQQPSKIKTLVRNGVECKRWIYRKSDYRLETDDGRRYRALNRGTATCDNCNQVFTAGIRTMERIESGKAPLCRRCS